MLNIILLAYYQFVLLVEYEILHYLIMDGNTSGTDDGIVDGDTLGWCWRCMFRRIWGIRWGGGDRLILSLDLVAMVEQIVY